MRQTRVRTLRAAFVLGAVAATAGTARVAQAAQVQIFLPLGRTAYQTNETIDVSVVRSDTRALAAGAIALTVTGEGGSKMAFTFPVSAVPLRGASARTTEDLHLDGWLLRPGKYTAEVTVDGATATTAFTVYGAVRKSSYRTIHWGGPSGDAMLGEGESGLGFNVILAADYLHQEPSIAAGLDIMGNCLMGGGHQHDLIRTNDWSDPNVYIGAIQRGLDRAFAFRTLPNAIGAHLHDEPGLTWLPNPHSGVLNDQDIPPQRAAYERAFGREALWSDRVDPRNPAQYAQWTEQNDFKLGFMEAFWKASDEAIARLKPGFLPITQSQYGWYSLFDGYYFNVVRSLPLISGHGGYNDFGPRNLNPSLFLEMAMPRNLGKPNWYLPEWYGRISADEFRLEHNLSFITGIQGMSTPPEIKATSPSAPAVSERNHFFERIGTIFTVPEYTSQDVTLLYSKSNQYFVGHEGQPGLDQVYFATKLLQYPIQAVLEEDVLDGSLAAQHKAVVLTGLTHLDPPVVLALEQFVKGGGAVIETADCTVPIKGAVRIAIAPGARFQAAYAAAKAITDPKQKGAEMRRIMSFHSMLEDATRTAALLKPALLRAGIKPAFTSDVPAIAAGKQVRGEIEYDFAVNFATAPADLPEGVGVPAATSATIALPDDGRPIYDLAIGKAASLVKAAGTLAFGPGQMFAFARPARPIGGVVVAPPIVSLDTTRDADQLRFELTATLVDTQQKLIAGNAPMEISVTDPLGVVRYDLYRGAQHGVLSAELPLAANDPAGVWSVTVTELLAGTHGTATFTYRPGATCGALAGKTSRAVVFGADVPNVFRFFRDHRAVTIVPGSSPQDAAGAKRLADSLKRYNVTATIATVADVNKARPISDEDAVTWCGDLSPGKLDATARTKPEVVGYDLPGPTILIGNAADNPLVAFLVARNVLPYKVTPDFPGAGHGMVAWNLMTLGHDIETLALIGDDAAGIDEAVGTAFQMGIGIDPLTPYALPSSSAVSVTTAR